jgi:hypothetical protein
LPSSPYVPFSRTASARLSDDPVNDLRLAFTCVLILAFKERTPTSDHSTIAMQRKAIYASP